MIIKYERLLSVFDEGHTAFRRGKPISSCPYDGEATQELSSTWFSGWMGQDQVLAKIRRDYMFDSAGIDAYEAGRAAYLAGQPMGACPFYGEDSQALAYNWMSGWDAEDQLSESPQIWDDLIRIITEA